MGFVLPRLPYAMNALEPHVSGLTVDVHYERHHRHYVEKLNELVSGSRDADRSLEDLVQRARGEIFENAAQVWNHTCYWNSLTPAGRRELPLPLVEPIRQAFRDLPGLRRALAAAANGLFGSGYVWLVADPERRFHVIATPNADNPLRDGLTPLLAIDVWEHAYYLDRRNRRDEYVAAVVDHLLNWDFAVANLAAHVATQR
jgi:Fe-Mn family superoxide dismutase